MYVHIFVCVYARAIGVQQASAIDMHCSPN